MAKRAKKTTSKPKRKGSARNIRQAPKGDQAIELIGRGVWVHGGKVLLCSSVKKGYFYLPGGHIEFAESAREAVKREFLEETGLSMEVHELALVTEGSFQTRKRWHHEINLVFRCSARNIGAKQPAVRSKEPEIAFDWADLAAIVDLDVRPTGVKAWLTSGAAGGVEWVSEMA